MEIPFAGPFSMAVALAGIAFGMLCNTLVFYFSDFMGPALSLVWAGNPGLVYQMATNQTALSLVQAGGDPIIDAIGKTMAVTACWCFLYYNYVGVQVGAVFNMAAFKMFTKDDVTEKYAPTGGRFAGNMFEQSPVFLVLLWAYTLLVDYETGGYLGILYMVTRLLYPFLYMIFGEFTMWFEFITQTGYGVNGIFMLGVFMNGLGGAGSFGTFATDNPIWAPISGFLIGSFAVFPYGNPISLIYGFLHYKCDRRRKFADVNDIDTEDE